MLQTTHQYKQIRLRAGKDHLAKYLHPWLFSQAIEARGVGNGELADLYSSDGKTFVARGYFNANSQISFRILTRNRDDLIDEAFFEKKFKELVALRERFIDMKNTNAYRVVFGESDGIPGLIVDKYNKVFVIQIHTMGIDRLREVVVKALVKTFSPDTIFEKSDVGVRNHEGLKDMPVQHLFGKPLPTETEILENNVKFLVNIKEGQKTGFFLDQRENRKALQKYCAGKRVLNCFCYTAGFSVYAALAGAKETVSIDVSGAALETAKRNFAINGLPIEKHKFIDADVFDAMAEFEAKKEKFDVIVLDPPAFVKNQKSLKQGLGGYLFINERALKLLPPGGILVSSSCSAHVTDEMFQQTLTMAATRNRCDLKIVEIKHQPIDHPYSVHFPEGKYLKYYVTVKV